MREAVDHGYTDIHVIMVLPTSVSYLAVAYAYQIEIGTRREVPEAH